MSIIKKTLKWSLITIVTLVISFFAFGYWFLSLLPKPPAQSEISQITLEALPYLSHNKMEDRGKILTVVTSTATMGTSGKKTGYELTELSRAYYVFQANGYEVDVASPLGGNAPRIIDDEDMGVYDYAFLNDPIAQQKTSNTISLADVDPSDYAAVYFVGGKGAMWDFPDNPHLQSMLSSYLQFGKIIGAVCHGPAALVNVKLENGRPLLKDRAVCGFTNEEELFLIPDASNIFPFLLEEKLIEQGASFVAGNMYLENVVHDQNIITGQNPWSTWKVAETMIKELGYEPKMRAITPEEHAIDVLTTYRKEGYKAAKNETHVRATEQYEINRILLAQHSILEAMQWNLKSSFELIALLRYTKLLYAEPKT